MDHPLSKFRQICWGDDQFSHNQMEALILDASFLWCWGKNTPAPFILFNPSSGNMAVPLRWPKNILDKFEDGWAWLIRYFKIFFPCWISLRKESKLQIDSFRNIDDQRILQYYWMIKESCNIIGWERILVYNWHFVY